MPALMPTDTCDSPEMLEGKMPSRSTDVYAFAITAYELLSGKLPYGYMTDLLVAVGVASERSDSRCPVRDAKSSGMSDGKRPDLASETVSPSLVRLLEQCWDQNFQSRPTFLVICDRIESSAAESGHHRSQSFGPALLTNGMH